MENDPLVNILYALRSTDDDLIKIILKLHDDLNTIKQAEGTLNSVTNATNDELLAILSDLIRALLPNDAPVTSENKEAVIAQLVAILTQLANKTESDISTIFNNLDENTRNNLIKLINLARGDQQQQESLKPGQPGQSGVSAQTRRPSKQGVRSSKGTRSTGAIDH
jgi:hypothetical protein